MNMMIFSSPEPKVSEKGVHLCMYIYGNTHSQPLLQNRLMDVYETW